MAYSNYALSLVGGAALAISIVTSADAIQVNSISGEWTNVVGGANVTNSGSTDISNPAELRWGYSDPANNSGYDFLAREDVPFDVLIGFQFEIGDFSHINKPIPGGTAISSAQLDVLVDIDVAGSTGPYQFSFLHDETPNSCSGVGCSDDIVDVGNLDTDDSFFLGGLWYTLNILGFSTDGGTTISNQFISPEGGTSTAGLYAIFAESVAPPEVPIPAALPLFGTGLALMGFVSWRRKRKAAV